jgi:amidase
MLPRVLLIYVIYALLSLSSARKNYTGNATLDIESQILNFPYPYEFPQLQDGSNVDNGLFPMPLCRGFKLEEASIDQLQQAMSNGTLTSVQIVLCYLKRIYQIDEYIRYYP